MQSLPNVTKGLIIMLVGVVLLFHTLGIMRASLSLLIIIGSILMIGYGFMEANGPQLIRQLSKKYLNRK